MGCGRVYLIGCYCVEIWTFKRRLEDRISINSWRVTSLATFGVLCGFCCFGRPWRKKMLVRLPVYWTVLKSRINLLHYKLRILLGSWFRFLVRLALFLTLGSFAVLPGLDLFKRQGRHFSTSSVVSLQFGITTGSNCNCFISFDRMAHIHDCRSSCRDAHDNVFAFDPTPIVPVPTVPLPRCTACNSCPYLLPPCIWFINAIIYNGLHTRLTHKLLPKAAVSFECLQKWLHWRCAWWCVAISWPQR